jgi:hypothetical protein
MRMTMTGTRDSVTSIKIQVLLTVTCVDPDAFTAFGSDCHLLVSRELKLIFARNDLIE